MKLLYVGGSGRSGSTLLSVMLNGHSDVVSVGELKFLGEWRLRRAPCTCGESINDCPFWQRVLSYTDEAPGGRPAGDLLRAVTNASGAHVVVDTSKTINELKRLMAMKNVDVHVIHLVRDGRGYLHSRMKALPAHTVRPEARKPRSALKAILRWVLTNFRMTLQARSMPSSRFMRVRYEDLVASPECELRRICHFVGLPFEGAMMNPDMAHCHDVGGNGWRYREAGTLRLELDASWKRELSRMRRLMFGLMGGWLNRLYGYH